jgi:diguanylate cyclase (GGDEF)-like protein/PAS domain S-box-containing protein
MSSILVVDDDALIREIAKDILSSADHTVFTAKDSYECFNVLKKEAINVVLLDLVLSSESGMDLIPTISEISPKSAIIMMTAHASTDIAIEALRKGAYDFLQKPLQETHLLHSLNKVVDRQSLLNQNETLLKSLEERLTMLEIYKQVSTAISSTLDLQELLKKVMQLVKTIIHAEACSVLLHDEKTGELVFTVALGKKTKGLNKISIKSGQGICGWVYKQKKPLLIRDAKEDKRFYQKADQKTGFDTKSMITVPLLIKNKTLGVIQVINKVNGDYFEVEDLDTLMTLSAPVAIAIDNARITEELKMSEEKFHEMSSSAQDAIIMMNGDGKVSFWNTAAERLFGYLSKEAVGNSLNSLIVPSIHTKAFMKGFEKFKSTGKGVVLGKTMMLSAARKDKTEFPVEISTSAVKLGAEWNTIGIIRDITERKEFEDKIRELADHDQLTGLPNRRLLIDRFNQVLARARRYNSLAAFLFLDLDRFKTINDSLGHAIGDELLKAVAGRLKKCIRSADTVARIGGDEFTIVVQDIKSVGDITKLVEKIFSLFDLPFGLQGNELFVTTSMGISIYPNDGEDANTLIKNADIAMYKAKNQGRNNYKLYTPAMNQRAMERLKLENKLRRATEREEFILHYQPQVEVKTGKIVGMEALVRWIDPEKGIISPADFIPLAEETGLIVPIGEWVLQAACKQQVIWREKGLNNVKVAVNISIRQFQQPEFLNILTNTLKKTGIEPSHLELELTESIIMDDVEKTIDLLREIISMGIKLAIDDFGTGYSSMEYLKKMPLSCLKIAMPFVHDICVNKDDKAISIAIIKLAHSLGLNVIAEGVEDKKQYELLESLQCDIIQGYLVSKPQPVNEIEGFLKEDWTIKRG